MTVVSILGLTGAATGTAAFTMQHSAIKNLCWEMDQDFKEVGNSLEHLKNNLEFSCRCHVPEQKRLGSPAPEGLYHLDVICIDTAFSLRHSEREPP